MPTPETPEGEKTGLKPWYCFPEGAARAAIKFLGLTTTGNAGGWLWIYADGVEVWHGHGYHAAWPWLAETYRVQLSPLPLVGQVFIRTYGCPGCGHVGERRSFTPLQDPPAKGTCKCGQGPVPICGACRHEPVRPDGLICEGCAAHPQLMNWWEPREREWRERFGTTEGGDSHA